jgi:hypothetical protein
MVSLFFGFHQTFQALIVCVPPDAVTSSEPLVQCHIHISHGSLIITHNSRVGEEETLPGEAAAAFLALCQALSHGRPKQMFQLRKTNKQQTT